MEKSYWYLMSCCIDENQNKPDCHWWRPFLFVDLDEKLKTMHGHLLYNQILRFWAHWLASAGSLVDLMYQFKCNSNHICSAFMNKAQNLQKKKQNR
jgi:hypothetical protein